MPSKYHAILRLLSILTISLGLLLARAHFTPDVPAVVRAAPQEEAEPSAASTRTRHESIEIPESNPYHDPTQCTYGAWEFAAAAGHKLPRFGNAMAWRQKAIDAGYAVLDSLSERCANSVVVWGPGVGGASGLGHVGWVKEVKGDQFLVQDRNWIRARDDTRWVTWQEGMSFIVFDEGAGKPEAALPAATSLMVDQAVRALAESEDASGQGLPAPAALAGLAGTVQIGQEYVYMSGLVASPAPELRTLAPTGIWLPLAARAG